MSDPKKTSFKEAGAGKSGNLLRWPEWLRGADPLRPPVRHTFATWKHYTAESPLLPSGLLGPVRLTQESE